MVGCLSLEKLERHPSEVGGRKNLVLGYISDWEKILLSLFRIFSARKFRVFLRRRKKAEKRVRSPQIWKKIVKEFHQWGGGGGVEL